jgi:hypothetical protein
LVENLVILLAPSNRPENVGPVVTYRLLNKSRTPTARQHHGFVRRSAPFKTLGFSRRRLDDYVPDWV